MRVRRSKYPLLLLLLVVVVVVVVVVVGVNIKLKREGRQLQGVDLYKHDTENGRETISGSR